MLNFKILYKMAYTITLLHFLIVENSINKKFTNVNNFH